MTTLQDRTDHRDLVDAHLDEASLLGDWLGLATYLSDAVASGEVTVDTARAELASEATGVFERRALGRAAELAAARLGPHSPVTALLQSATQSDLTYEVA